MRIVVSSDWQAQLSNLPRLSLVVDQVIGELKRDPKSFFVHCGDVKEKTNPVDLRVINWIDDSFTRIKRACSGVYYVRGNHDNVNTLDGSPSICTLMRTLGLNAVADDSWQCAPVRLLTWGDRAVRNLWLYLVPYLRDPDAQRAEFAKALDHVMVRKAEKHDDVRLLFFHNSVTGTRRNGPPATGLTADEIGAGHYDLCVGGHEHMPQELRPNIHVVGSPCAIDWGEANVEHRILVIDVPEEKRK